MRKINSKLNEAKNHHATTLAKQAAEVENDEVKQVQEIVLTTPIESHEDLQSVTVWLAEIKSKYNEVEDKRKAFTQPLQKVVQEINAFFAPALDGLKLCETNLKNRIIEYTRKSMRQRDEILDNVKNLESVSDKQEALVKADLLVPPKIDGLSMRESWDGRVVDKQALIEWCVTQGRYDLLEVSKQGLVTLTKAQGKDPEIPGWKAIKTHTAAITVDKIRTS